MNGSVVASGALSVISAMVTPALMILAAASLASSALLRMGRIVDRARLLALMVHEGKLDQLGASSDVVARWLKTYRARAQRTALAVFALYAAIVLFVGACLLIGLQHLGLDLPDFAALALVLPGAVFLLGGAVGMAGETGASRTLIVEEIDNALASLRKDATN
jgi:hypothetical protein